MQLQAVIAGFLFHGFFSALNHPRGFASLGQLGFVWSDDGFGWYGSSSFLIEILGSSLRQNRLLLLLLLPPFLPRLPRGREAESCSTAPCLLCSIYRCCRFFVSRFSKKWKSSGTNAARVASDFACIWTIPNDLPAFRALPPTLVSCRAQTFLTKTTKNTKSDHIKRLKPKMMYSKNFL